MSTHQLRFKVTNIECESCLKVVELTLRRLDGVSQVLTDLATGLVTLLAERPIEFATVRSTLAAKGYTVADEKSI